MQLNRFIDHTLLKPNATGREIENLCREAMEFKFCSVCVNPLWVAEASKILKDNDIKVCSVTGFPLGSNRTPIKIDEAVLAVHEGASEIDLVASIGKIMEGDFLTVENELNAVRRELDPEIILKVIIETPVIPRSHWAEAVKAAVHAGADFVKTATGFSGYTPVEHVTELSQLAGNRIKIKAAGGIKTSAQALEMIHSGASRIGCSASVALMKDYLINHEK